MSDHYTKCFGSKLKDLGLTTWNEINLMSAILDQFDLKSKKSTTPITELEMSTAWLSHLLLDMVSTAVIERALQAFGPKEEGKRRLGLLSYRVAKNKMGKTVRWISLTSDELSNLIRSPEDTKSAKQALSEQGKATTKSKKMWEDYNNTQGVFDRMAKLDSQHPASKLFVWAFDHISERSCGTRYEWTTQEVGKLMHNGLWVNIKDGHFDFGQLEAYGAWKTKKGEAPSISEFLKWLGNPLNRQYMTVKTTPFHQVASLMRKDASSFWYVGETA